MLEKFSAYKSPTNRDLIIIDAVDGMLHTIACVVTLDTLADVFGRKSISQDDAVRAVQAEINKFGNVISSKYKYNLEGLTPDPKSPNVLRCDLTLQDLQVGGQTYSASVLDAPATAWGKEGKF